LENGLDIKAAEQGKDHNYPELVHFTRFRLVVLACEVGGQWSAQTVRLIAE
jgi:hypothetical protein